MNLVNLNSAPPNGAERAWDVQHYKHVTPKGVQGKSPLDPFGSRYQRGPEAYSLSVGLSRVSARLGSICEQATWMALIAAVGATYEFKKDGLTTDVII